MEAWAINATLKHPGRIYVDNTDNVFINDYQNGRIRKISKDTITTVAGNGTSGYAGDGGKATAANLKLNGTSGITTDLFGNLFSGIQPYTIFIWISKRINIM
jgi:hypothetical protein